MLIAFVISVVANVVLLAMWLRRERRPLPVIKAADFDATRCDPIAVAIRLCDDGVYLANPETGRKLEFTNCTAWSGRMAPQANKASIVLCDIPPWPGHKLPPENVTEILLDHVPLMN